LRDIVPTLIEMRLKASWAVRPDDTKSLHGLACALFEGDAAPEAAHVGQDKPWSVSPLRSAPGNSPDEWLLRAAWLPDSAVPPQVLAADTLRVGHASCAVTEATRRRVTHAALTSLPAASQVTVEFTSPCYFSRNGTGTTLPDPRLIVGSWRRRWNSSVPDGDPVAIAEDAWQEAHRLISLAEFDLRTQSRDSGHGQPRSGFVGTATLRTARGAPRATRAMIATLAAFAEFCGTGAQVTHGFGATSVQGTRQ
jgi:CRISPR-associated endoribonuclease Cas6